MDEDKPCVMCAELQSKHREGVYCPQGRDVFGYDVVGLFQHPFMENDK